MPDPAELWWFLPLGYAITVAIEIPILLVGLSPEHPLQRKLLAGFWLTTCTYPIVVLVLPLTIEATYGRTNYLAVAETFAPVAECLLFWLAFRTEVKESSGRISLLRDCFAIVAANLASFLLGGWLYSRTAGFA